MLYGNVLVNVFASCLCLPTVDMRIQIVMNAQLLHIHLFRPLYQIFCNCPSLPLLSNASHNYWF